MNLAFVISGFGIEKLDPLKIYCRITAENLYKMGMDITIYTIADEKHRKGEYILNGVLIKRFPHEKRDSNDSLHLISRLLKDETGYDAIIFFELKSPITLKSYEKIKNKKIIVPFLYGERERWLPFLKILSSFDAIVFITEREKLNSGINFELKKHRIIEFGIKEKTKIDPLQFKKKYFILSDYILCHSNEERSIEKIVSSFKTLKTKFPFLSLIIWSESDKKIPFDPDIKHFNLKDDNERWNCIKGAILTIYPSQEDTPDFSVLESMALGVPVVVNENSKTLVDYCIKSNGGLWYSTEEEFLEVLSLLIRDRALRNAMGKKGYKYVKESHSLEQNFLKWKSFLSEFV